MNITDYSTKVKNLANALVSIRAPIDDEDLMAMTLNGLGKYYSMFCTSIAIRKTFPDFQDLITLFIMKRWELLVLHLMEDHKKVFSIQILIEVEVEVLKFHFEVDMNAHLRCEHA